MNDHIAKPINVNDMFSTMALWITASQPVENHSDVARGFSTQLEQPINFPDFQHIETKAGLATTQNNQQLYLKLLKRFEKTYSEFEEAFRQTQTDDDQQAPERWAHTLKGTSANIGAEALKRVAATLEQELKAGEFNQQTWNQVSHQLTNVLAELKQLRAQTPAKSPSENRASAVDLKPLIVELESLIDDYDTEAADKLEFMFSIVSENDHKLLLQELSDAIESYDFEQASESLKAFEQAVLP